MGTPVSFVGALSYPPDTGQPNASASFNYSGQFDSADPGQILRLTGAGTESLDLGTIPAAGLKVLCIKIDPTATPTTVNFRFNGGGSSGQIPVSSGGQIIVTSPNPNDGITAVDAVYTADVVVRVWAFG